MYVYVCMYVSVLMSNCPCFFVDNKQELNDFMKKELDENTDLQLRSRSSRAKKSRSDDSCDEASYLIFFQLMKIYMKMKIYYNENNSFKGVRD